MKAQLVKAQPQSDVYSEVMTVTPKIAQQWLEKNTNNRPIRQSRIDKYARQMKLGNWMLNGEPIIISISGRLLDGQGRLHAIVQSGCSVPMNIVYGVADEVFSTIDIGDVRSGSDALGIAGHSYSQLAAPILRAMLYYKKGHKMRAFGLRGGGTARGRDITITNPELVEYAEDKNDKLTEVISFVVDQVGIKNCKLITTSNVGFLYWLLSEVDAAAAREFLIKLLTGEGLKHTDVIYICRERLIGELKTNRKLPRGHRMMLILKAWVALRKGKVVKQLSWSPENGEQIPDIKAT